MGHSLGEYVALVIAGVLTASDMIYLVGWRSQLVQDHCTPGSHGMLAVSEDVEALTPMLEGTSIEVSCINGPKMSVLGGTAKDLADFVRTIQLKGTKCVKLPIDYAYHTAQINAILTDFNELAQRLRYGKPQMPVFSSLLGVRVEAGSSLFDANYLCRHAKETVNFRECLLSCRHEKEWTENAIWLEIGPHPTCANFVRKILTSTTALSSLHRDRDPWETLSESVCRVHELGVDIDWVQYHRGFESCHKLIDLPSYAWDLKR
jgi:acyl transferase domain-containing protein